MKKGFTLLEVLLAISLMGIFFATLSYSFYSIIQSTYSLLEYTEKTKQDASLFWELQRKLIGAKDLYLKKDALFIITTSGDYYQGIVKCAYIYKDGWLYYYEFPYPYADISFYEEDKLIKLFRFKEFHFKALVDGKYLEEFRGLPQALVVSIGSKTLIIGG